MTAGGRASAATPGALTASRPAAVLPLPAPGTGLSRAELSNSGFLVHDFVAPGPRWGAGHRGVDLAAAAGATVLAPWAGTVSFAGVVVDRPLVVLTHADGLRSTLEPVTTDLVVGDRVLAGADVGTVADEASTHCAPSWCLHWGVRRGEEYLDPLALSRVIEAVILLPVHQATPVR